MEYSNNPHTLPKSKAMKEQSITNPVLPYGVPFEGSTFKKVSSYVSITTSWILLSFLSYSMKSTYRLSKGKMELTG
jgi:hypothetical protein